MREVAHRLATLVNQPFENVEQRARYVSTKRACLAGDLQRSVDTLQSLGVVGIALELLKQFPIAYVITAPLSLVRKLICS